VVFIEWNAIDWADDLALRLAMMTDALRAQVRIDDINFWPHADGLVWAFGFADVAVNAVVGDDE
jgi:hypothetical protein